MKTYDCAHEFAFYSEAVQHMHSESTLDMFELTEPELVHRITFILRLSRGDRLVLFDRLHHVRATVVNIELKKSVLLQINAVEQNKRLTPAIHWLLPLLKREAFEEALYSLTELGVSSIQPIITQKTTRFWGGEREIVRSVKMLLSAAEQSKQFVIPKLHPLIPLDLWILRVQSVPTSKLFFDPSGIPLSEALALIEHNKSSEIVACAGPEGDLTYTEKMLLTDQGFIFTGLTPTILRAQQAITVGLGALRSLLNKAF